MIQVFISAITGIVAWYFLKDNQCSDEALRSAASAYASVAVTMLGFMMAMLAILVTISDRRLIRNMAKTGHYGRLLHQMYWATAYFGVAMLGALASLFMSGKWLVIGMSVDSGLVVGACYVAIGVGLKLRIILVLINPPSNTPLE